MYLGSQILAESVSSMSTIIPVMSTSVQGKVQMLT